MELGLTFDDVLLIPRKSTIGSRFSDEIRLDINLFNTGPGLQYPIISANMDTVTGLNMANAMHRLGGLGIVHRFLSIEDHISILSKLNGPKIACIGVGVESLERLYHLEGAIELNGVLIDIAHGHCTEMIKQIKAIRKSIPSLQIIAGNIATQHAALDLIEAGANCLKIGVGPGSLCTTRLKTGCGVPQLTAIWNIRAILELEGLDNTIIADGGIRNSGDVVKALAAGAHAVMIGSLFAGTEEAPGDLIRDEKGISFKQFRGMASREAQLDWKGKATSVEGESTLIPYKGSVNSIFNELINGILSGMSYQNARNLAELRQNAQFIQQTSAGYRESTPHLVHK